MESFLQDIRVGFRAILRRPSFALIASATLALGVGANTAMLSFAEALLRHPLPYEDPQGVMVLWRETEKFPRGQSSFPAYFDWQERNRVFSELAMFLASDHSLTGPQAEPERLSGVLVSANFAKTLGVRPYQGRFFGPDNDRQGSARTVVLSYELWQRRFGSDPGILEETIRLDDEAFTVIGILPPGLSEERIGEVRLGELWLPIGAFSDRLPIEDRGNFAVWTVGRLEDGITLKEARDDMARISRELAAEYPSTEKNIRGIRVVPIFEDLVGSLRPTIYVLLVTVSFVLLMGCINLINLQLSHTAARQRDLAVRCALGAGRRRLAQQVLTESLALVSLGVLPALGLAWLTIRFLPKILPGMPYANLASLTPEVLGATVLLCVLVAFLIGSVPALQSIRPSALHLVGGPALPAHKRWRQVLIVVELALATALLTGAALVTSSLERLREVDLGFSTDSVLTQRVILPESEYGETEKWTALFDEVLERLAVQPGVERIAVANSLPLIYESGGATSPVVSGDQPIPDVSDMANTIYLTVSPDFFRTMSIPLLEGRNFTPDDDDRRGSPQVVVISQMLAREFWGSESAIGKRIAFEFLGNPDEFEVHWREVVGVVGDVRSRGLDQPPKHTVYVPYTQLPLWAKGYRSEMALVVKTVTNHPLDLAKNLRSELFEIAPQVPVFDVLTLQEIVDKHLEHPRMVSTLLSCFAGLALVLAIVGVYGVLSYLVVAQTHDLGMRMALGATPRQVLFSVLRDGLVMIALGIGTGVVLAWNLTSLMSSLLHGVEARDPRTFASVALSLAAVAFVANLFPALRAMRLNPSQVLRWE